MFMIKNATKYLFGKSSKDDITEISQGKLYLVRPHSLKGTSELIFNDAAASIRRTGQPFQYQLVIQRVYGEGEAELTAESEGDAVDVLEAAENDEKVFLLDQSLQFRCRIQEQGEAVFAWRDLSGDFDDLFEFVCDESTKPAEISTFEIAAVECQYERKFRRPRETATEDDLQQFNFESSKITRASPSSSSSIMAKQKIMPDPEGVSVVESARQARSVIDTPAASAKERMASKRAQNEPLNSPETKSRASASSMTTTKTTTAPHAASQPVSREILAQANAELHLYDFNSGTFVLQDPAVVATVHEIGDWDYWLQISGAERAWLGQRVVADLNPVFNFEYLSFIFNHYTEDGSAYSWLLRFKDQATEEHMQDGIMRALWEQLNEQKWIKVDKDDQQYVLDAFQDMTVEDGKIPEEEGEEEEEDDDDDTLDEFHDAEDDHDDGQKSEHYDTDEETDNVIVRDQDGNVNSQLAVGYKHDRSFVVRGNKIGVFKHTPNNNLEFSTNISKVTTPRGQVFSPKKVMLHAEDSNMILQNEKNPNALYRMDLEYGRVVDEWKVHDDIAVKSFAPDKKFAQMTNEQTFIGLDDNALYRIDPRVSGNKLVDSQCKTYVSKHNFSTAATTEQGHIAVASDNGEIRMFDRLGIRAKTALPALGEPIIGVDVSADGHWILATCRTYLILVDALQKDGKNQGKTGFQASFSKDSKPQPRRLALSPTHVAQFQHETKVPISFTPAHFNAGLADKETSIITATGPFIITWSIKKILAGRKDPYTIKRYAEEVKADDFKYGSDKNVIVALANEVNMVAKQSFRKPTRESIAAASTPRRSSARRRLGRSEVVASPF